MHNKGLLAQFLLASYHFCHTSRKASNISRVCGLSHQRVVAWTFTKEWQQALDFWEYRDGGKIHNHRDYIKRYPSLLEITDLESAEKVVILMYERNKGIKRVGDLNTAEQLWTVLISENAHINVPDAFDSIYQVVFGEENETEAT